VRIFITGVTGQDGSYLAERLLAAGHDVYGLVRGQRHPKIEWLHDHAPGIKIVQGDLTDQMSLVRALDIAQPHHVYNLGAVSAPALGWNQPVLTAETTGLGLLRLLEAVLRVCPSAKILQASSIALHGPYGAAKQFAQLIADDYRNQGMHVSCAVLAGHHSPRRGDEFFARKVTKAVADIFTRRRETLTVGPLGRMQDWGWADNFIDAEQLIVNDMPPGNYTVATGDPHSNEEWVRAAFAAVDLDWREHVRYDNSFKQPTDVEVLSGTPSYDLLAAGWVPNLDFEGLAKMMVEADI
jgi:GDPmannose 4,6-dehydratase